MKYKIRIYVDERKPFGSSNYIELIVNSNNNIDTQLKKIIKELKKIYKTETSNLPVSFVNIKEWKIHSKNKRFVIKYIDTDNQIINIKEIKTRA